MSRAPGPHQRLTVTLLVMMRLRHVSARIQRRISHFQLVRVATTKRHLAHYFRSPAFRFANVQLNATSTHELNTIPPFPAHSHSKNL